jgi:hypothetical protein
MENYIVSDYQNWNDLAADLTADLNGAIPASISASHTKYGDCTFSNLSVSINENNFYIIAEFDFADFIDDSPNKLAVNVLLDRNFLQIADSKTFETLKQYVTALAQLKAEVRTTTTNRLVAKREADKLAAETARQEAKYLAAKTKAIRDFEFLAQRDRSKSATSDFYYSLGWLAKNVGTISAALPDYLLEYFEKQFGTGYKPTVVDSKKRTVNGNAMQWTLSMKASISKKAVNTVPAFLKQYLNNTETALTNTSFIWDLVENYGFQFGKTQDVDKIRLAVPTDCIESFENGYAE